MLASRLRVKCPVLLAASLVAAWSTATPAADSPVVAVIASDGYADLKKQLGWLGTRVGNAQLPALAESFVMMATQFRGLAGLDVNRPAGVIVTAAGDTPKEEEEEEELEEEDS